jgi:hypothetical protein
VFGSDVQLPPGALLLHIGPHKTGTTALQGALHNARPDLLGYDVVYGGRARQAQMAALAVTGGRGLAGDRPARAKDWDGLVRAAQSAPGKRFVISSEFFDDATDEVARRVVSDLGSERVHVVVTLRPLAMIIPSAWQQYVRNRFRMAYGRWLDVLLNRPDERQPRPSFWYRHRHDVQVDRWASIVGPERLLVVVVDESDRESLMRTFEQLLVLPNGLLKPETGWTNRSLTAAETELIRAVNVEFFRRKLPVELYHEMVHRGIVRQMQLRTPAPDEPRITTPAWAVEVANDIAAAAADRIAASGVRVLGDLSTLSAVKPVPDDQQVDLTAVSLGVDAASRALLGAILAANARVVPAAQASKPPSQEPRRGRFTRRIRYFS